MTRQMVESGFPGPGQVRFHEQAKESGRIMGLTGEATILDRERTDDGGGAPEDDWTPRDDPVRARIDPAETHSGTRAASIDETTTHIITFDPNTDITTANRVEMEGRTWVVTGRPDRTDELVVRVEVKEGP